MFQSFFGFFLQKLGCRSGGVWQSVPGSVKGREVGPMAAEAMDVSQLMVALG